MSAAEKAHLEILSAIDRLGTEFIKASRLGHNHRAVRLDASRRALVTARDNLLGAMSDRPECANCHRSMVSQRRRTCSDRCRESLYRRRTAGTLP